MHLPNQKPKIQNWVACPLLLLFALTHAAFCQIVSESHPFTVQRAIPDGDWAGLSDTHSITSSIANITSLRVNLRIAGEFNGDLYAYLRHTQPGRTNLCVLLNRPGRTSINPQPSTLNSSGYADAGLDVTFDDAAANDIHLYQSLNPQPSTLNLTGTWQPDGRKVDPSIVTDASPRTTTLASFNGATGSGQWTLYVADVESGGANQLVSWELELHGFPADTCPGIKGDVSPRPHGSGPTNQLTLADWVLLGRFIAGLEDNLSMCESNRADCAPRPCGNGLLSVGDWVQAGRYVAQLDPQTSVCTTNLMPLAFLAAKAADPSSRLAPGSRSLNLGNLVIPAGATNSLDIVLQAKGNENALGFSLAFDTHVFSFVSVDLGSGAADATLIANTKNSRAGQLGFIISKPPGHSFTPGQHTILTLCLRAGNETGSTAFAFTDEPIIREVTDAASSPLSVTYTASAIVITSNVVLQPPSKIDSNTVLLSLVGPAGRLLTLETSPDLVNWHPLFSLTNHNGTLHFHDVRGANAATRFYRAVLSSP